MHSSSGVGGGGGKHLFTMRVLVAMVMSGSMLYYAGMCGVGGGRLCNFRMPF